MYFNGKYDFTSLDEGDLKLFAVFGQQIIAKYPELGIQNLNVVFTNSPYHRETEPLVAHFVPRVNMAALYEIRGVNVVDTPPRNIFVEFNRVNPHGGTNILWPDIAREADGFDPDKAYEEKTELERNKDIETDSAES